MFKARWTKVKNTCSTFPRDVTGQILLKSIDVSQSYSKIKGWRLFLKHSLCWLQRVSPVFSAAKELNSLLCKGKTASVCTYLYAGQAYACPNCKCLYVFVCWPGLHMSKQFDIELINSTKQSTTGTQVFYHSTILNPHGWHTRWITYTCQVQRHTASLLPQNCPFVWECVFYVFFSKSKFKNTFFTFSWNDMSKNV